MLRLVTVCRPAKAFIFYSGHSDVCTAIIITININRHHHHHHHHHLNIMNFRANPKKNIFKFVIVIGLSEVQFTVKDIILGCDFVMPILKS